MWSSYSLVWTMTIMFCVCRTTPSHKGPIWPQDGIRRLSQGHSDLDLDLD